MNDSSGSGKSKLSQADWAKVYAKAWLDPTFREHLEKDPASALTAFANELGLKWDSEKLFKLPARPKNLSKADLEGILKTGKGPFGEDPPWPPACC